MPDHITLAEEIDFLIGTDRQRLVYLHSDHWICSKDPELPDETVRHFFLPADWLTINNDLMIEVVQPGQEILFVKRDEVAVIKRGLFYDERGLSRPGLRRPVSPFRKGRNGSEPSSEARDFFKNLRLSSDRKSPSMIHETTSQFEEDAERDARINSMNSRRSSMISRGSSFSNGFTPISGSVDSLNSFSRSLPSQPIPFDSRHRRGSDRRLSANANSICESESPETYHYGGRC